MMIQLIQHFYNEYMREVLGIDKIFNTTVETKVLSQFVVWVQANYPTAGEHWVKQYIEYQFGYWIWYGAQHDINLKKLRLAWVLGDKARERYELHHSKMPYFLKEFRKKFVVDIKPFSSEKLSKMFKLTIAEENERERHHNTEAGLLWCFENTTMFHPLSKFCLTCGHKEKCLQIQQRTFPQIAAKRQRTT